MATLTSSLDTPFSPAVGSFSAHVTGGTVMLLRRPDASSEWASCGSIPLKSGESSVDVDCVVAGTSYKAVRASGSPVFRADQ